MFTDRCIFTWFMYMITLILYTVAQNNLCDDTAIIKNKNDNDHNNLKTSLFTH